MKYLIIPILLLSACERKNHSSAEIRSTVIDSIPDEWYKGMPSYGWPENYTMIRLHDGYYVLLPHGTVESGPHSTIELAQDAVNKSVNETRKDWILGRSERLEAEKWQEIFGGQLDARSIRVDSMLPYGRSLAPYETILDAADQALLDATRKEYLEK